MDVGTKFAALNIMGQDSAMGMSVILSRTTDTLGL